MNVTIKYFGSIAEATGVNEEVLSLEEVGHKISELKAFCVQKYGIEDEDSIQTALNQELIEEGQLKDGDEIALLPPFAGG